MTTHQQVPPSTVPEPEHGATFSYWHASSVGEHWFIEEIRGTYHRFTAWKDHPWQNTSAFYRERDGADFVHSWSMDRRSLRDPKWHPSGRSNDYDFDYPAEVLKLPGNFLTFGEAVDYLLRNFIASRDHYLRTMEALNENIISLMNIRSTTNPFPTPEKSDGSTED
jgi:hypothetical protein